NGTIDRFPDGTPTGVLKESAQHLVRRIMPRRTPEQVRAGMRALADAFNRAGMTGVKDPGIGPRMWEMYRDVLASGDLSVRVFCSGARQDLSRSGNHVGRRVGLQRHPVRREQGTMGVGGAQDTARQMFMEDKIGSIEVGKYADIAVWDRDLYAVPADSLENLTALVTVFNGKVVYRSVGAPGDWPRGR
ncbi:MAG: amidohydrolase family protein, partial [Gemmatimonadales bacterium]